MLPVNHFTPNAENLRFLWEKFNAARDYFTDEFPEDPIHFVVWVSARDSRGFLVGPADKPVGFFLFSNIVPDNDAFGHVFLWDLDTSTPVERVIAAQIACAAMFESFNLVRINGLTPAHSLPALVFAERVGFKREGKVRKGLVFKGVREDAFLTGLLREDLEAAWKADKSATMKEGDSK